MTIETFPHSIHYIVERARTAAPCQEVGGKCHESCFCCLRSCRTLASSSKSSGSSTCIWWESTVVVAKTAGARQPSEACEFYHHVCQITNNECASAAGRATRATGSAQQHVLCSGCAVFWFRISGSQTKTACCSHPSRCQIALDSSCSCKRICQGRTPSNKTHAAG